jgi:hypothetical protein
MSAVGAGGAVSAGAPGSAAGAAQFGAAQLAAGAQHDGAGAQHDELQQLFLHPQRASAEFEQRTRPAEHSTAAAANFIMISLLAKRGRPR